MGILDRLKKARLNIAESQLDRAKKNSEVLNTRYKLAKLEDANEKKEDFIQKRKESKTKKIEIRGPLG